MKLKKSSPHRAACTVCLINSDDSFTVVRSPDHDEQRMFLPHYLIIWECQGSASRPVDNSGDMAGWSRTRVQGALALDTQRGWACPRSHTAPGGWRDVTCAHPATKIVFSQQYVMSRAWPAPPSTKGPTAQRYLAQTSVRQQVSCDETVGCFGVGGSGWKNSIQRWIGSFALITLYQRYRQIFLFSPSCHDSACLDSVAKTCPTCISLMAHCHK